MAWELTNGKPPDGLHVLHRCDNPPCCNPAHLFLGTDLDNCHDKIAKGRQNLSVESYQRRADSLRGKPRSAEARANMSAALKGKKQKPEHVAKRNASNRGLKRSAETRRRLSEARSRWWAAKREALAGQARHLVEYPR